MVDLKFHWLGSPSIECDGRPLKLEMRKTLAILAYLSLSSQSPTRETLAANFWPEFDQAHALANLRRNLSSLVQRLPLNILEADRERIGLKRDGRLKVDVDEFKACVAFANEHVHPPDRICPDCTQSLEKAAALYQGDFFEGFNLKDCQEFDEWQTFQRETLRVEYASVLQKLSAFYQIQGQWEKAIAAARSWLSLDRLNENALRILIGLYIQSGQRSQVQKQFDDFAQELNEQFGQSPAPETIKLIQQAFAAATAPDQDALQPFIPPVSAPTLKTKLYIPSSRSKRVRRERLIALLEQSSARELTLVSAPAGYGKTTMLAEWATSSSLPVAWVSLDAADNDPNRFFVYVCEAINSVHAGAGDAVLEMLRFSLPVPLPTIVSTLLNAVNETGEPFALVLDDYHLINAQSIHSAVAFMLEHSLPVMHLIISTRVDPPLPLARLRSRQQLAEIRASTLRFYPEETTELLQHVVGLDLKEDDIRSLESRTEGWIAGLQMAVLSMQGRQDLSQFIQTFSGSHRYIMDYLVDEVLNRQPEELQKFLLQTSILKRMSGALCDALLEQSGSQAVLEKLERENLFVVSLDDERRWYRFHHLFTDLLYARLEQQAPESIPDLHIRCSNWYEANQLMDEAVEHALDGKDFERAARLIESLVSAMLSGSGGLVLQGWIERLPTEIALSRPWLCLALAWMKMLTGVIEPVEELLQAAERGIRPVDPARSRQEWLGQIAGIRAFLADFNGDTPVTIKMAEQALEHLPVEDVANREKARFALGRAYLMQGSLSQGIAALADNIRQSLDAGTANMLAPSLATLSKIYRLQGRLHEVMEGLQEARGYIEACDARRFFLAGNASVDVAGVLREWNDLDAAETTARRALENTFPWGIPSATCTAYIVLGRVLQSQGRLEEAAEAMRSAEGALRGRMPFSDVLADLNAAQVRLWVAMGEPGKASKWAQERAEKQPARTDPGDTGCNIANELEEMTLSRLLIATRQFAEAEAILTRLSAEAESGGRNGRLIEMLVLLGMALAGQRKEEGALQTVAKALMLGQKEGYVRVFLDEGEGVTEILKRGMVEGTWEKWGVREYVARVLKG